MPFVAPQGSPPPEEGDVQKVIDNKLPVEIKGSRVDPWDTFDKVKFPREILKPLLNAGFQTPSPVQAYSWPVLDKGLDR